MSSEHSDGVRLTFTSADDPSCVQERDSWALATLDEDGRPAAVLLLLDDPNEAEEIAFELRRLGRRVVVVPFGPAQEHQASE